jgi:CheY-like chemotaxis protein
MAAIDSPLIVVAEDDAALRALLATVLGNDGCRVVLVDNGAKLVSMVEHLMPIEPPQLVITDVKMPGMNGLDAAAEVRRVGHRGPVIVMTAYGDDKTRARAAQLGACVLDKPMGLAIVRSAVRSALAG